MISYLRIFLDYIDAIDPLDDAERGRLFTALLSYAQSGVVPPLSGNERFVFPMMKAQIDRDRTDAEGLSEVRRAAGRKGAQVTNSSKKRQTAANTGKSGKDKDKDKDYDEYKDYDKDEDKDHDKVADHTRENLPAPAAAVLSAYASKINPVMSGQVRKDLTGFANTMGCECCLRAFDIALDAKKASWPYIRAILQAKQAQGVRSLADWDHIEAKRKTPGSGAAAPVPSLVHQKPVDPLQARDDFARMDKYLASMKNFPAGEVV